MKTLFKQTMYCLLLVLLLESTGSQSFGKQKLEARAALRGGTTTDGKDDFEGSGNSVNFRMLEDGMHVGLNGNCTGYSFSIYSNGVYVGGGAGGNAQLPVDGANISYAESTRGEIASCTKVITSMMLCNALEKKGISINSKIGAYLPSLWVFVHPTVQDLTFKQVLAHRSGLVDLDLGTSDEMLANFIPVLFLGCDEDLLVPGSSSEYEYEYNNANYRLAAYLFANVAAKAWMDTANSYKELDQLASAIFIAATQGEIFVGSGVTPAIDVYDWDNSSKSLRLYNFANTAIGGLSNDDNTDTVGPRGFVMNSSELARIISAFELTQTVSKSVKKQMKENELGIFLADKPEGKYYFHRGGNTYSNTRGRETIFVICPGGVVVTMMVNSKNNLYGSRFDLIRDSFLMASN